MTPEEFRRLVSAGLSNEQIAVVMEMMAAKDAAHAEAEEARKAKGRDRVAKWRADRNVTETLPKVTEQLVRDRVAPAEDKLLNTDNNNPKNTKAKDLAEFREALASLGSDRLDAMVKVRKAKNAPLNAYAARLFIKAAGVCDLSVEVAADMCIERNWLTVKPDWIKPASRASPAQASTEPRNIQEASRAMVAQFMEAENGTEPDQDGNRLGQNVRYLTASSR